MSEPHAYVGLSLPLKSHPLAVFLYPGDDDFWWNIQAGLTEITEVHQQNFPSLSLPFRRGRDGSIIKWFRKRHSLFHWAHFLQTSRQHFASVYFIFPSLRFIRGFLTNMLCLMGIKHNCCIFVSCHTFIKCLIRYYWPTPSINISSSSLGDSSSQKKQIDILWLFS